MSQTRERKKIEHRGGILCEHDKKENDSLW